MKRIFLIAIVFVVALSALFLLTRQLVIENVRTSSTQAMKIAQDGLQRKLVEWETDLQYLARQKSIAQLLATSSNNARRQASTLESEAFFIQFLRLRKDYIKSIRLIDRYGRERVLVDENGASRDFTNVTRSPFFQRGMAQRPFQAIPTLHKYNENLSFEFSIPITQNGFSLGLISFGLDLPSLAEYFTKFSEVISFSHVYIYDDDAQLVYSHALKTLDTPSREKSAKSIYLEFINNASGLAVLYSVGTLWAHVNSEVLNFTFLLEMEAQSLNNKVLALFLPIASIFLLSAILLLFLRKKGRRISRKGSLIVSSVASEKGKHNRNNGDVNARLNDLVNVSNEVRMPLNNVLGMLSLLRISSLTKKQTEYLDLATRYSEWILELLNEITDFSALKRGKLKLDTVEFEVRQTIKDVSEILNVEAYKKGLEIFTLVNADVPDRVAGDPTRLRQVLVNLIGNAIKFTEQGDISINATVDKSSKSKIMLRIEVSDSGVGIDADIAHTVFTEFEKAQAIPAGENSGVGLGLSITKQLVELMGGKIGFRENALGGSTFWLVLPYRLVQSSDSLLSKGSLNGLTAFMVAESSGNRQGISKTLSNWGVTCDTSANFESGHSILSRSAANGRPYDILIVDISTQGVIEKVYELVRKIRSDQTIQGVHIIMLSARGSGDDRQIVEDLNIRACLTKPISRNQLKHALLDLRLQAKEYTTPKQPGELTGVCQDDAKPMVLVVESNQVYQKLMVGMLAQLGVAADIAVNAKDAFQAIKAKQYGMLLVDAQLPDVDVVEFVQRLRGYESRLSTVKKSVEQSQERVLGTSVVMMANSISDKASASYREAGVDEIVQKPINIDVLSRILNEWDMLDGDVFPETEML